MEAYTEYVEVVDSLLETIELNEGSSMKEAGKIIGDAIMQGGILQAFGSGHSIASAMEAANRAGGLIPTKLINDPAEGMYEMVEGVGEQLVKYIEIKKEDAVIIISNSGRNPLGIEMAMHVKEVGAKLIVVTSLDSSKQLSSRHHSGKLLYQFADVVLDTHVPFGDASIKLPGLETKVSGTSSIASNALIQGSVLESLEYMVSKGYQPPIYISANVDGGREYNAKLEAKYEERMMRK